MPARLGDFVLGLLACFASWVLVSGFAWCPDLSCGLRRLSLLLLGVSRFFAALSFRGLPPTAHRRPRQRPANATCGIRSDPIALYSVRANDASINHGGTTTNPFMTASSKALRALATAQARNARLKAKADRRL